MRLFGFVILTALFQVACGNAIRSIQARSRSVYAAVATNYVVAFLLAVVYCLSRSGHPGWRNAVAIGVFTGFFYTVALITIIRSMGQRGMAMTIAVASLSGIVPVLMAIAFGERPSGLQIAGIVAAMAAMPLLSLATVSGTGIREHPSAALVVLIFVLQGGAMSGNLLAGKLVAPAAVPIFLVALFASGLIFSLGLWAFLGRRHDRSDIRRGGLFGLLNVLCTLIIVTALGYEPGSIFFAAIGAVALAITTLTAVWWWRERVHAWGWVGLALAAAATPLLVLK